MKDDSIRSVSGTGEDEFRRLFRHTNPRARPSAADEARIRSELHADWHAAVDRGARRVRIWWGVAAAAVLVLAIGVFIQIDPVMDREPEIVAVLERIDQGVDVIRGETPVDAAAIRAGFAIAGGEWIETGAGRAALELANGGSLRLDTETRIAISSDRTVELVRGSLYFDSQMSENSEPLTVFTRLGTVRDIGTQFIARLETGLIAVSVREGAVEVSRDDNNIGAEAGERLMVLETGTVTRQRVNTYGDEWDWADSLAPPFDLDGQTVFNFLSWIERQTGRRVIYASAAAESAARASVLRGGLVDLEPLAMLRAVLATTDLSYSLTEGEISVAAP